MREVIRSEVRYCAAYGILGDTCGERAAEKGRYAVADKRAYLLPRSLRKRKTRQHMIDARGKIAEGIKQRAVEVE